MGSVLHVIDDDEAVRESLEALLLVAGYEVESYGSAAEFLARAPDDGGCLLLDVNMPGMSGLDLLGRLDGSARRRPVLVLTACRDPDLREQALALGARDFLVKPIPGDALLHAVAEAISPTSSEDKVFPV